MIPWYIEGGEVWNETADLKKKSAAITVNDKSTNFSINMNKVVFLQAFKLYYLPVCQDVRCGVNLVGHMSDTSFWNGSSKSKIIFFLKNHSEK